ncbi:MAG: polysaccharide deacetylase family protein [Pseudomonadota bacterium]
MNGADKNKDGPVGAYRGPERRIGRIDQPANPRAHAALPEDFGQHYVIFVDTEEEFDWAQPLSRDNISVTAMEGLPGAQRFFREAGALPAYMVDYPIVDNDRSAAIICEMRERDGCEIGTQLHPWVNPPFDEEVTRYTSFTGNLPTDLQRAKLERLTERIAERVGERPILYRAGRYGIGEHSATLLEAAGYRMDTSVRALFDYSGEGGPDFSRFPTQAFWAGPSRTLLELPLTSTFVGPLRRFGMPIFAWGEKFPIWRSVLARTRLLQRVSLTPEDYPLDVARQAIERLIADGLPIIGLSYHSPSVVPGHTPYVRDAADLRKFYAWWDGVFDLFARHGVTAIRAGEIIAAADRARKNAPQG